MLQGHTTDNIIIVADFDRTITHGTPNCETAFNIFSNTPGTPDEMMQEKKALYEKYRPIEIDESLSLEERLKYMKQWHNAAMDIMGRYITPERYEQIIEHAKKTMQIR
jgi:hypothetical protein